MEMEYIAQRKKLFRSDFVMLLLVLLCLAFAGMLMAYMDQVLEMRTSYLQIIVFFLLAGLCYLILNRQMLSYKYVLKRDAFLVYKRVGRKETLAEQVELKDVAFLSPYASAPGPHGREHALCTGKREGSYVLAHMQKGKPQWLLFSPNDALLHALQGNILAAREFGATGAEAAIHAE